MSTSTATMGHKGRIVVPLELRRRHGWDEGSTLVFVDDGTTVNVMSADDALAAFRASVASTPSPVDELIAERRAEAEAEKR
ncbi:MAG: AbrB/MazE/SpoVT family DNA-binding domain-containing protein [Micrococcales bacterium]|nr:AbrB/MazE/SpoVT family DNA-binding domain-containing protein [Micrococcales bacterium]